MVNLTTKWSLPLFTDTDVFDPIQTPLGLMSTATEGAISKVYVMGLPVAASQAERDLLYPVGVAKQGDGVYRSDLGYSERYFGLYNATTNKGGRVTAGWGSGTIVPQKLGTTATLGPMLTQTGIERIQGGNGSYVSYPITFPLPFLAQPVIVAGLMGYKATGAFDPTGLAVAGEKADAQLPTVAGTTLYINSPGTMGSAFDYYVSWIAIGPA